MSKLCGEAARSAADGPLANVASGWLAARYVLALSKKLEELPQGEEALEELRRSARDMARFQRGDHLAARLALGQARLAAVLKRVRRKPKDLEKEFWEWTKREDTKQKLWPPEPEKLSPETVAKIRAAAQVLRGPYDIPNYDED